MVPLTPVELDLPVTGHLPHSNGVKSAVVEVQLRTSGTLLHH